MINLSFVLRLLKGRCYGNLSNWGLFANIEFDCLLSLHWRFEMKCSITICIMALTLAMIQLHRVKFGERWFSTGAAPSPLDENYLPYLFSCWLPCPQTTEVTPTRALPHCGGRDSRKWSIGLWPSNSNSVEIYVQCTYATTFIILSLIVRKLSCLQTNKRIRSKTSTSHLYAVPVNNNYKFNRSVDVDGSEWQE